MRHTLLIRLAGPMQAWGTGSQLQVRRTDLYPSKSGVLGLLLCAMGVDRAKAAISVRRYLDLRMGVRIDRPGEVDWDYHTAGAKIGILKAEGGVKKTASTGEPETSLSSRQYLLDASFLVGLEGEAEVVEEAAEALQHPVWPVFLGRKCCVPAEPVFAGVAEETDLKAALASHPVRSLSPVPQGALQKVPVVLEHLPGKHPPEGARLVYDVPLTFKNPNHGPRWVAFDDVEAPVEYLPIVTKSRSRRVDYASEQWKAARRARIEFDGGLCVFCKLPAEEVHHVTYENVGAEKLEDLRSLCKTCHSACTQMEYGHGMQRDRVDPSDPNQREAILRQIGRLLRGRREGIRRGILERTRQTSQVFLDRAPG